MGAPRVPTAARVRPSPGGRAAVAREAERPSQNTHEAVPLRGSVMGAYSRKRLGTDFRVELPQEESPQGLWSHVIFAPARVDPGRAALARSPPAQRGGATCECLRQLAGDFGRQEDRGGWPAGSGGRGDCGRATGAGGRRQVVGPVRKGGPGPGAAARRHPARQQFFGLDNVDPTTGAVRRDRVIMSWAGVATFAASFKGHVVLLDDWIPRAPTAGTWKPRRPGLQPGRMSERRRRSIRRSRLRRTSSGTSTTTTAATRRRSSWPTRRSPSTAPRTTATT